MFSNNNLVSDPLFTEAFYRLPNEEKAPEVKLPEDLELPQNFESFRDFLWTPERIEQLNEPIAIFDEVENLPYYRTEKHNKLINFIFADSLRLSRWLHANRISKELIENLNEFVNKHFSQYNGAITQGVFRLYTDGVKLFHFIVTQITNDDKNSLSLERRLEIAKLFLDNCDSLCEHSALDNLNRTALELTHTPLASELMHKRQHLLEQFILDQIDEYRKRAVLHLSHNSRFFVNAILFRFSQKYGLPAIHDDYAQYFKDPLAQQIHNQLTQQMPDVLSVENLLNQIIRDDFFNFNPLKAIIANQDSPKLNDAVKKNLIIIINGRLNALIQNLSRYGKDEAFDRFHIIDQDVFEKEGKFKLLDNAEEYIRLSLLFRLANSGYINLKEHTKTEQSTYFITNLIGGIRPTLSYMMRNGKRIPYTVQYLQAWINNDVDFDFSTTGYNTELPLYLLETALHHPTILLMAPKKDESVKEEKEREEKHPEIKGETLDDAFMFFSNPFPRAEPSRTKKTNFDNSSFKHADPGNTLRFLILRRLPAQDRYQAALRIFSTIELLDKTLCELIFSEKLGVVGAIRHLSDNHSDFIKQIDQNGILNKMIPTELDFYSIFAMIPDDKISLLFQLCGSITSHYSDEEKISHKDIAFGLRTLPIKKLSSWIEYLTFTRVSKALKAQNIVEFLSNIPLENLDLLLKSKHCGEYVFSLLPTTDFLKLPKLIQDYFFNSHPSYFSSCIYPTTKDAEEIIKLAPPQVKKEIQSAINSSIQYDNVVCFRDRYRRMFREKGLKGCLALYRDHQNKYEGLFQNKLYDPLLNTLQKLAEEMESKYADQPLLQRNALKEINEYLKKHPISPVSALAGLIGTLGYFYNDYWHILEAEVIRKNLDYSITLDRTAATWVRNKEINYQSKFYLNGLFALQLIDKKSAEPCIDEIIQLYLKNPSDPTLQKLIELNFVFQRALNTQQTEALLKAIFHPEEQAVLHLDFPVFGSDEKKYEAPQPISFGDPTEFNPFGAPSQQQVTPFTVALAPSNKLLKSAIKLICALWFEVDENKRLEINESLKKNPELLVEFCNEQVNFSRNNEHNREMFLVFLEMMREHLPRFPMPAAFMQTLNFIIRESKDSKFLQYYLKSILEYCDDDIFLTMIEQLHCNQHSMLQQNLPIFNDRLISIQGKWFSSDAAQEPIVNCRSASALRLDILINSNLGNAHFDAIFKMIWEGYSDLTWERFVKYYKLTRFLSEELTPSLQQVLFKYFLHTTNTDENFSLNASDLLTYHLQHCLHNREKFIDQILLDLEERVKRLKIGKNAYVALGELNILSGIFERLPEAQRSKVMTLLKKVYEYCETETVSNQYAIILFSIMSQFANKKLPFIPASVYTIALFAEPDVRSAATSFLLTFSRNCEQTSCLGFIHKLEETIDRAPVHSDKNHLKEALIQMSLEFRIKYNKTTRENNLENHPALQFVGLC